MACKQQKLTCSSGFAINSGYNYTFNVNANIDLSAGTVHFNIKSNNDPSYLFQLTNTNDDSISGLFEVNMSNGVFDVNIIGLDSEGISGVKVYECYFDSPNGKEALFEGSIEFYKGVI
jgi:hypothetical protein